MSAMNPPHVRACWSPRPKGPFGPAFPFRAHQNGHTVVRVGIAAFTEAAFKEADFKETVKPSQALPIPKRAALVDKVFGCNREEPIVVAGGRLMP
jgi:hypothetical protein